MSAGAATLDDVMGAVVVHAALDSRPRPRTIPQVNDDAPLLERIRQGDTDAFAELVRRHQTLVFGILHRYERDAHRVEDLSQETFLKAWKALEQFDGRAPFAHWLSRIAVNVALDHLRKRKRAENELSFDDLGPDALEWLQSGDSQAELRASQARELLDLALRRLSPQEQLVLTLQELDGHSIEDISRLTGWSRVATRVRAFRARQKLRQALEDLEASVDSDKKGKMS